ncbi:MAG: hypothetical protein HC884_15955 [Chloroflexaceae bacterium]|nr:hypothetical protein [Chloroflexaceae bacterium]
MKLPPDVIIPREKLTDYLLVFRLKSDKSQFLAQAGFTRSNPDALEKAIREMIATHDATLDRQDRYGNFYRVEGTLRGVNKRDILVVTIWILQIEKDAYRFVTLKPWRKKP